MNTDIFSPRNTLLMTAVGFAVLLTGTVGYILHPHTVFEAVFVAGLVVMAGGYALQHLGNRDAVAKAVEVDRREEAEGFFYIMDEDYSAPVGDATIEDLTRR